MRDALQTEISFAYVNSPDHRIHHADGMYGGGMTQNRLVISFYAERPPVPLGSSLPVTDGVVSGAEVFQTDLRFVRELQATVTMDIQVGISFLVWLEEKVKEMYTATGKPEADFLKDVEAHRNARNSL